MDMEQNLLLSLASSAITCEPPCLEGIACPDWGLVHQLACEAKIDGLIFETVASMQGQNAPGAELLALWKHTLLAKSLTQLVRNNQTADLLRRFTEAGVPYVLFKGPVLSDLYKNPGTRFSIDVDILAAERDKPCAERILRDAGFLYQEAYSKENVGTWRLPGKLCVELHTQLWEDYQDERVAHMREMRLTAPESLLRLSTFLGPVTTLGHTEHLIYQVYHIAKHIAYRGIRLRNFIDTALFVNRYMEQIDVARFWASMKTLRYERLCRAIFGVCAAYFRLDRRIWPNSTPPAGDTDSFLPDIMYLCFHHDSDAVFEMTSGIIFHSVLKPKEAASGKKGGRFRPTLALLFPGRHTLSERYAYAKRRPFLLPVAWLHRALRALFSRDGVDTAKHSLRVMNNRTDMLRKYNLLD